jgi:hypothetical protein
LALPVSRLAHRGENFHARFETGKRHDDIATRAGLVFRWNSVGTWCVANTPQFDEVVPVAAIIVDGERAIATLPEFEISLIDRHKMYVMTWEEFIIIAVLGLWTALIIFILNNGITSKAFAP